MDVSREKEVSAGEPNATEGNDLVRSIVAISGLPDASVRSELMEILSMAKEPNAQSPELSSMSLDDLRSAMLVYLESIHADMMAGEADDSADVPNS